jgi:hypothetical protein
MTQKRCKDCPPGSKRPVVVGYPGPRCATHKREHKRRTGQRAHARHINANFEITADEYWAIYAAQGGRCPLCLRATGKTRRLAFDHDHQLAIAHGHDPKRGCRRCIRGLLDKRCNHFGVPLNVDALVRALNYLHDPPAQKVLHA